MGVKTIVKNILPQYLVEHIRNAKSTMILSREYKIQAKRFRDSYSREWSTGKMQVQSRTMFLTHQLEKGLSHKNFRYGFGLGVFEALGTMLTRFENADSQYLINPVYKECMSAIHEYIIRHQQAGKDLSKQSQFLSREQWNRALNWEEKEGGTAILLAKDKINNSELPFSALVQHRHSLREYSDQPVTQNELRQAVQLATAAPSACNRQPARVVEVLDQKLIAQLLNIQGGVRGYATPPALLLVTAKQSVFMGTNERNQGYVDGGLFSMMLLLSLESIGLASCPLHTMFDGDKDQMTRDLLHIPDDEILIMYIEVGHYPDRAMTPQSTRLPVDDVLRVVK